MLCASGLQTDDGVLAGLDVTRTPRGCVAVDPVTYASSVPGLYAAGDIATGPSLVAQAVGQGRLVAIAVHKELSGLAPAANLDLWIDGENHVRQESTPALPEPHVVDFGEIMRVDYHAHAVRREPHVSTQSGPALAFAEWTGGLDGEDARLEAERCLHCGHCLECGSCVESCPGHILTMSDDGPAVAYPGQCWHCGCCRIACPTGSIAYRFPLTMLL